MNNGLETDKRLTAFNLAPLRTEGAFQDYETGEVITDPEIIAAYKARMKAEAEEQAIYTAAGIKPFEFKVLVLPNEVAHKTKGGLLVPDTVRAQQQHAVSKGRIAAVSPFAFTYFDPEVKTYAEVIEKWPETPRVGDLVLFGKYSGGEVEGNDGKRYRIMNDKDIIAGIEDEVKAVEY